MLIEFAGIPGSGKTHVCKRLRQWMSRNGVDFVDVDEFIRRGAAREVKRIPIIGLIGKKLDLGNKNTDVFLRSFISFFRKHHEYVHRYSTCLFERERDEEVIRSVLSAFLYGCARYAYCVDAGNPRDGGVVIHEEGFTHRLFTLFGYDRVRREAGADIRAVAERMPAPQIVFWTRCSSSIAYDRLLRRSGKRLPERMAGMERAEVMQILADGERNLEAGLDVLQGRGVEIIAVPTDDGFRDEQFFDVVLARLGRENRGTR